MVHLLVTLHIMLWQLVISECLMFTLTLYHNQVMRPCWCVCALILWPCECAAMPACSVQVPIPVMWNVELLTDKLLGGRDFLVNSKIDHRSWIIWWSCTSLVQDFPT